MGIVLKGGTIYTATDHYQAEIRIVGETIDSIGHNLSKEGDTVLDITGYYVLPGGIDTHTHFDLDVGSTITADDFSSGTKAALMGGTTTILDFATQFKNQTLKQALDAQHQKSQGKCFCDYGFHMGITDWNDQVSLELADMIQEGVTSFKLYMAYKNNLQVDDEVIFKALKRSKEVGGLFGFHCENGDVIEVLIQEAKNNQCKAPFYHAKCRPAEVEKEAITRLLEIAKLADAPVNIVHLSSKEGLQSIIEAKKTGAKVTVETCPQYLLLNESYYGDDFEGAKYVMSPPLRKETDQKALWEGLSSGEIITIGTDHCSFNYKGQKEIGLDDFSKIPNGAPGVEHRMALMYTHGVCEGRIDLNQMVALTSTNAAKLFGLFPKKGTIAVGSDADLMIWDPSYEATIQAKTQTQQVDYTPYEGFKQKGRVLHGFLRGQHLIFNGVLIEDQPLGTYLVRKPQKGGRLDV